MGDNVIHIWIKNIESGEKIERFDLNSYYWIDAVNLIADPEAPKSINKTG